MPSEEERLVVSLEARVNQFEKNMQKAERTGTRSYKQLAAGSTRATHQMESDMVRSTNRINQALAQTSTRIGAFGKAFIGGLAVGAAVGALEGIRQAAIDSTKSILEMGDSAKRAGVSFTAFQKLKFVAEQNRVGVDALTDGLKEMNLRADEFILTGKGSSAEAFQRLGYNAEELAKKLKAPDELFLEIIGKLEKLDKAAQIRIADEIFGGTGGEQFVQLISRGEKGIRAQIKAAEDLGIVMDESMVKKAEEVNQKFEIIATTIGTKIKEAIVNAVSAWFRFLDSYKEFKDQQQGTLSGRQSALGSQRIDLENERMKIQNGEGGFPYWNKDGPLAKGRIHEIEMELAKIAAEERQIVDELNKRVKETATELPGLTTTTPSGTKTMTTGDLMQHLAKGKDASHVTGMSSGFESKLEKMLASLPKDLAGQITITSGFRSIERQQQLWQAALEKYGSVAEARKWVAPPGNSQHNKGNAADLGYGSDNARKWAHDNAGKFGLSFPLSNENWHVEDADARAGAMADRTRDLEDRAQAYDDLIQKAREFVAEQGLEGQALGMTEQAAARLRYEQELLNEARSAGLELSPAQIESIKALAAEMANAEAQTMRLAKSQEELRERAEEFGAEAKSVVGGFISDLRRGTDASDALRNALSRIGDTMIDKALSSFFTGGKQGGGIFGSLFSGLLSFDGGGDTGSGPRSGGVDGKGGFPAIVHPDETIVDHTKPGNASSSAAQSVHVTSEVKVSIDKNGDLRAFVEKTSQKISNTAVQQGIGQYDKGFNARFSDAMERVG